MRSIAVFLLFFALACSGAKAALEFVGCLQIGTHVQVAICDTEARQTIWASVGEAVFEHRVAEFDRRTDIVTLRHRNGTVLRLPLKTAKVVSAGAAGYTPVGRIDERRHIHYASFEDMMKDYSFWSGRRVVVAAELKWDVRIAISDFDPAPDRAAAKIESFVKSAEFEFAAQPDGSAVLRLRR